MSHRHLPAVVTFATIALLATAAFPVRGDERPIAAEPEAVDAEYEAHLKQKRELLGKELPGLDLEKVTLSDAVDALRDTTKVNMFVNWRALEAAGVARDTRVSIVLKNVTLGQALQLMLDNAAGGRDKLGVTVDDGVVTVSTVDDLSRNTLTRVYDARDLVRGGADGRVVHPQRLKALQRLLMNHVEPKSWRDNGGDVGAIRELQGQLIVTQTPENQKAVKELLADLRNFMRPAPAEGEGARAAEPAQEFPLLSKRVNRGSRRERPGDAK